MKSPSPINPWASAQEWELGNSIQYMNQHSFADALEHVNNPEFYASTGFIDDADLNEFFSGNREVWIEFIEQITGKRVMEIGPCLLAKIAYWDVASERIAIEPLFDRISRYQNEVYGKNGFPGVEVYSSPAEKLIPELVGKIDGALFVRNCIDHSPNWPFILGNISRYLAPGGQLLIWNDLFHPESYRDGHYDICDDKELFRELIISFGFRIDAEWDMPDSACLNYGCRAVKI
jgi:SAM-dependent methyltransferase